MRTLIFSALLLAGTAAPALAQDAPFNGPRAEGVVGWDQVDSDGVPSTKGDGVVYGGAIGYDFQMGSAVFGPEVELTGTGTDTRARDVLAAGDEIRLDAGRDIYAGVRGGFVLGDSTLLYAKGGYTNTRFKESYDLGNTTIIQKQNLDGWRIGAGLEQRLNGNVYVKGEYRYSDYGRERGFAPDISRHQVVAGVGIRF